MKNRPAYKEPLSTALRRSPHGDKEEITNTIRWISFAAIGIFLSLIVQDLLEESYNEVLPISIGLIPIGIAVILLKQDFVSIPSTILSVTIISLITYLAAQGHGFMTLAYLDIL